MPLAGRYTDATCRRTDVTCKHTGVTCTHINIICRNTNISAFFKKQQNDNIPVLGSMTADIEKETVSLAGIGLAFTKPCLIALSMLQLSIVSTLT